MAPFAARWGQFVVVAVVVASQRHLKCALFAHEAHLLVYASVHGDTSAFCLPMTAHVQ